MKTIFGLFKEYEDAEEALSALLENDFDEEEMNVLVREDVAKQHLDVDLHEVNIEKTDDLGMQTVHGLTQLLGGERPVHLPTVGEVLAGGELATILSTSASSSSAPNKGFIEVLEEFGVTEDVAGAFQNGIIEGGVLVWIRVDDEQASNAANTLRSQNGQYVADYS